MSIPLLIHDWKLQPYWPIWQAMQQFTAQRTPNTPDEIWFLQHEPVFTLGLNGKSEFIYSPGDIPVIRVDRGGQITYHGPGQLMAYLLIDLKRRSCGVRTLITYMENSVIQCLQHFGITAYAKPEAPGVYIEGAKIAAVGLRIQRGCSYHGLSVNIDLDLTPFTQIAPCGYPNLPVTQLRALAPAISLTTFQYSLQTQLLQALDHSL